MQPLSPDKLFTQMEGVISAPRLSSYLRRAGGDHAKAFSEYQHNIELAEVFYGILQWTEVILRNALHKQLVAHLGSGWYHTGPFDRFEQESLDKAVKDLFKNKPTWQSGDLISELAFGFWTGILHNNYDVRLWRTCLYLAFDDGGKRPRGRSGVGGAQERVQRGEELVGGLFGEPVAGVGDDEGLYVVGGEFHGVGGHGA